MNFGPPYRLRRTESIVPMINIVFLLLIFFLMTATIGPPSPQPVAPPVSIADTEIERADALVVTAEGELAYGDVRGEEVYDAIAGTVGAGMLQIRADRALEGAALATILSRLGELGMTRVRLVVGRN